MKQVHNKCPPPRTAPTAFVDYLPCSPKQWKAHFKISTSELCLCLGLQSPGSFAWLPMCSLTLSKFCSKRTAITSHQSTPKPTLLPPFRCHLRLLPQQKHCESIVFKTGNQSCVSIYALIQQQWSSAALSSFVICSVKWLLFPYHSQPVKTKLLLTEKNVAKHRLFLNPFMSFCCPLPLNKRMLWQNRPHRCAMRVLLNSR